MARKVCAKCGTQAGLLGGMLWTGIRGKDYCINCARDYVKDGVAGVIATTSDGIDGHKVARYIDIDSVEIVVGSGMISEFTGDLSDFFGARSSAFEQKLQKAKRTAIDKLKFNAFERGGNAVIAVDLDYTEFSGNRIGVIANGTIVEITKVI
jgi:uncharacterized protein YbjQ (UPF0145 family)